MSGADLGLMAMATLLGVPAVAALVLVLASGYRFGARLNDSNLVELPIPTRLFDDLPQFDHVLTAPTARVIREWVNAIRSR